MPRSERPRSAAPGQPRSGTSPHPASLGRKPFGPLTTSGHDRLISGGQGDAYEFTGVLTGPTLTLSIVGDTANPTTSYLNGMQLEETLAPEPGTYAMMGLGFVLLALTWRTRRTAAA